jgi:hypothetical protein
MNARTTTWVIVLALVLAACVAPMPAPPPRVQLPMVEQTLPIQNVPAQNKSSVVQVTMPTDAQAKALLEARQVLLDKLMPGLPWQVRPYLETFAAIEVTRVNPVEKTPALTTAQKIALIEHFAVGVPAEVRPAIERYIETLNMPELTNAEKILQIEHNAVGVPPEVHSAIRQYIQTLHMP